MIVPQTIVPRPEAASALGRVVAIWRSRDIQIGELFVSTILIPAYCVWLMLPFDSFANPAFRFMAWIGPDYDWGAIGLGIAALWTHGVVYDVRWQRQVGALLAFFALVTIPACLFTSDYRSTGIPVYSSLALFVAILFVRQRWEIGAGEP